MPMRKSKWAEWGVSAPSVLWLTIFFVIPTLLVVAIAFHSAAPDGGIGKEWTLQTWRHIANPNYPAIIWRTLWISTATAVGCIILALPCAYAIARMEVRWRAMMAGLIMLPFWTSFVVRVFAWRTLLHPEGFLKHILMTLGLADANTQLLYNSGAILLVSIYSFLPFAIMPLYAAAEKFDFSLIEAARDLGAKSFLAFRKIFIPGIRRGVISAILMVFIPSVGSYVIPDLVGGKNSELVGNKIYQRTFPDRNLPHASALSTIMAVSVLLPLGLVGLLLRRQDKRELELKAIAKRTTGGAA
ncbi:MAG: ABC transporter permease [Kiritimatiellae bacterium]|nr:ABC transporter permease [Kiritimatiellia bacterium]